MPIEIRELVIKAFVEEGEAGNSSGLLKPEEKEEIINDCLDQIEHLLKDKLER